MKASLCGPVLNTASGFHRDHWTNPLSPLPSPLSPLPFSVQWYRAQLHSMLRGTLTVRKSMLGQHPHCANIHTCERHAVNGAGVTGVHEILLKCNLYLF